MWRCRGLTTMAAKAEVVYFSIGKHQKPKYGRPLVANYYTNKATRFFISLAIMKRTQQPIAYTAHVDLNSMCHKMSWSQVFTRVTFFILL
jgi:hypothetical protein